MALITGGLHCFLNLLDLAEDFFFFFLKKFNLKLLHVAIVPLQSSECYDVHGAVFRREVLPSPLMSGWNYISCEIGLIVPFTGIHLCHCNYIKFWERVYNWCDKAV